MRFINLNEQDRQTTFAREAAAYFAEDSQCKTYTSGDITPGCLFAIRWGGGDDCVAVIKLDDFHEPTCYENIIKSEAQ